MKLIKLNNRYIYIYAFKFDSCIDAGTYKLDRYLWDNNIRYTTYFGRINKITKISPYYICFNGEKLATLLLMMV